MTAKTVLIVDDDAAFADFVRAAIESVGHRAVIVTSGTDAADAFQREKPALVMLDLLLPKKDGFRVCEELRALPGGRDVPVAMMTGIYKKTQFEREGLEKHGACAYLIKPFGVREIWALLDRHVGRTPSRGKADETALLPGGPGASLADTPLASVFVEHLRDESTGVLFVRGAGATYVVYLRDGAPVFVRSNDPEDRFDCVLLRTGQVAPEHVQRAMGAVAEARGRVRLGQQLVADGHLSRELLETTLQLQLQLVLKKLFALPSGRTLFIRGEHPSEEDVLLKADPRAVIFKGARHAGCLAGVLARLPAPSCVLARLPGWEALVRPLALSDADLKLLQLADGATNVERFLSIAALAGADGPRVLFALLTAGLVEARHADVRARPEAPASAYDASAWAGATFAAAFLDLVRSRATGTLRATSKDGKSTRVLHVREGAVIAASSDYEEDRLADTVARLQLVPEAALDAVLDAVGDDASDRELARALVGEGALNLSEAYWACVFQVQGIVRGLLPLRELRLEWGAGPAGDDVVPLPDVPSVELAWDAARCLPEDEAVRLVGSAGAWWTLDVDAEDRASLASLSPAESALVERLREPQTLTLLVTAAPGAAPGATADDARTVLAALACTGGLRDMPAPDSTPVPKPSKPKAEPAEWPPIGTVGREPTPAPASNSLGDFVSALCDETLGAEELSLDDAFTGLPLDLVTCPAVAPVPDARAATPALAPAQAERAPTPAPVAVVERDADSRQATKPEGPRASAPDDDPHRTQPRRAATSAAPATLEQVACDLAELATDLSVLRRAFEGEARKVEVDRAQMASLMDRLVELARAARRARRQGAPDPVAAELVGAGPLA